MKKLIQMVVFLSFMFFGCSDSSNEPQLNYGDFVKGVVEFKIKNSVSFEQMIDTVFSIAEVYQMEINLYYYSAEFPEDSLQYIQTSFERYNFIGTSPFIEYDDNQNLWSFYLWIRGFKEENISQWYALKSQFNMFPIPTYALLGLLKVEEGKESYWINQLKGTGLFEWVHYQTIVNIGH